LMGIVCEVVITDDSYFQHLSHFRITKKAVTTAHLFVSALKPAFQDSILNVE
jgi:hypothetical protein